MLISGTAPFAVVLDFITIMFLSFKKEREPIFSVPTA